MATINQVGHTKVERSRVVSENFEKYICPCCEYLLYEAVQSGCGHRLCKSCAEILFNKEKNPYCPVEEDGEKHRMIDEDDEDTTMPNFFPDKFAQKEIQTIKVMCEFKPQGCKEEVLVKDLKDHLSKCKYATKPCRYCSKKFPINVLKTHEPECCGSDVVRDGVAGISKELEEQIMILKTTLEGMRKDLSQTHKELTTTRKELATTQSDLGHAVQELKDVRAKVDFFEQKLSTREQQLEEKDFRLSLLEAANYDGIMIWRISGFESRTKDARDARYTSIFSLPFYTGKYGYKMCLRLYPLGDGMGKNTHLSLFFVVMKSEYDSLLQWPFTNKVTLTLINQSGGPDVTDTFKPDPKSSSFQRPKTEMNVASGCPRFVPLDDLHRNGFIKDDTIFIKVKVETISSRY